MKTILSEMTAIQGRTNGRLNMAEEKISESENRKEREKDSKINQRKENS